MGNKVDICESDEDRVVRTKDGERMADVSKILLFCEYEY